MLSALPKTLHSFLGLEHSGQGMPLQASCILRIPFTVTNTRLSSFFFHFHYEHHNHHHLLFLSVIIFIICKCAEHCIMETGFSGEEVI